MKFDTQASRTFLLSVLLISDLLILVILSAKLIDYGAILVFILSLAVNGGILRPLRGCKSFASSLRLVGVWSCGSILIVFCSVLIFARQSYLKETFTGTILQWNIIGDYLLVACYVAGVVLIWRVIMVSASHYYYPAGTQRRRS